VLAGSLVTAQAAEPGVSVQQPWLRLIIPSRPAAGYFTLRNDRDVPRRLVGASSPGCGKLMLHQTTSAGGVDQMAMVKSVPVPAHATMDFSPGGYHLMCMAPDPSLKPGSSVPVTLSFADGGTIAVDFPVRGALGK
jgi:copper(I)-binding protein